MSTSDAVTTQSPALSSEDRSARIAVTVFPLLILAAFAIAMITPDTFKPLAPGVNWALGVIMFGMGLTLTLPDFGLIVKRPLPVLVGVVAQYLIMPLVGWALCYVFGLPDAVAVGVILVGCAPGGTASNVISYLAKADVALSVTMTSISTLLAPLMTPLLTAWLVGNRMPVDGAAMDILLMVLAPVLGGFIVRFVAGKFVEKILPLLPWISVFGICYVLLVVVSGSVNKILTSGALIIAVVICHNLLGYLFG
ncbi:MAG: bile acid:sodium symporter family protein, partial [Schaalia sp.]|nr:bile acid:sodium symporter family protein [Schaalia sp.]